ncbi:MICOS complex subunit MIC27 isoform X1 [Dendroctonus ponderosae]|uniref:MICOS complex subunit MIC27 isoform X1 n=1 Tax=Dendroctonus ponderosae TaxID=77166 RepID=UPI002035ACB5|nr:MICOS complex subunit MIC27 isoform X1 [Dendroctonus ponderosae]
MLGSLVIRRCLLPAAALVAEAKLAKSTTSEPQIPAPVCRPSELPIYTPEPPKLGGNVGESSQESTPNFIENSVKTVRQTLGRYSDEFYAYEKVAKQSLSESKQNIEWLVDYLRQEDNALPKAGAIGIGALAGLVFGLRGGFFKKTIYATTGALGMAAVCYPKEAAKYSQLGVVESKKYLTIAYNFAYGVKKDEPPLELPTLPKVPSSLSEAWDSVKTTASSLISDQPKVEEVKNTASVSIEESLSPGDGPLKTSPEIPADLEPPTS